MIPLAKRVTPEEIQAEQEAVLRKIAKGIL